MSGPNMGQVVPANLYVGHLFPKRLGSLDSFRPAYNRSGPALVTKATWPRQDPRAVGTAPILDLNGDGVIDALDDDPNARQAFGPGTTVLAETPIVASPCNAGNPDVDACYYRISGFDIGITPDPFTPGQTINEIHYSRFWTVWGIGGGHAFDDPRQLGYEDPPETTVITWNSYLRDFGNNAPQHIKRDQVLFLGGGARPWDSRDMFDRSWRVMP
jgi:hypothetical protein